MIENRIFFPHDKKCALEFSASIIDERLAFDVESFTLNQKLVLMRLLARKAPNLRPKNGEPGKLISAIEVQTFLDIISELRKEASASDFISLLDRVYEKTKRARNLGLPILLFR